MFDTRFFGIFFSTFLMASNAYGEEAAVWNPDVRGWEIRVDQSIGNGCFMFTTYEGGTVLRMQFNPEVGNVQFIIGNQRWRSLEAEKIYPMTVQFGNLEPWSGNGTGFWWGEDLPALVLNVSFENDAADLFIEEFMRMTGVTVAYDDREIAKLSLRGTYAAMQEVMACQSAMLENRSTTDPFSSGATPSTDDPFR